MKKAKVNFVTKMSILMEEFLYVSSLKPFSHLKVEGDIYKGKFGFSA